jgi:hypothetical protein
VVAAGVGAARPAARGGGRDRAAAAGRRSGRDVPGRSGRAGPVGRVPGRVRLGSSRTGRQPSAGWPAGACRCDRAARPCSLAGAARPGDPPAFGPWPVGDEGLVVDLIRGAPAFSRNVGSCGLLLRRIPRVVRGRARSRAWWRSAAARLTGPAWHSIPMTRLCKVAMTAGRPPRSWGVLGEGDVVDVVQRLSRVLPHDRAFQRTRGLVLGDEMALRRVVLPPDLAQEAGLDDGPPGLQLDLLPLDEGAERRVVRPEVVAEFAARAHPLGERLARAPCVGG